MRWDPGQSGPNEVFATDGTPRPLHKLVLDDMEQMGSEEWNRRTCRAHETMLRMQRDLGLTGEDKTHQTDYNTPRLISVDEWEVRGIVR